MTIVYLKGEAHEDIVDTCKRKYYWQIATDEACGECDGNGKCTCADVCQSVGDRYDEMIADRKCAGCDTLIGPDDSSIYVPGVGICCNRDCADKAIL